MGFLTLLWLSASAWAAPQITPHPLGGVLIRPGGATLPAQTLLTDPPPPLPLPLPPTLTAAAAQSGLISLDLQGADIHSVLRLVATTAGINIVASDAVQGKITLRLEDVRWDQALTAILLSRGLVATVHGQDLLLITPPGIPTTP